MLLKRIEAPTLREALIKAKRECGENALLVETHESHRGYVVVASSPADALPGGRSPRAKQRGKPPRRLPWTRGFAPLAERAQKFGISDTVLRAVEKALIGTQVVLDQPGDPALPRVTAKVLQALVRTTSFPDANVTAFVGPTGVGKTTTLAKVAARAMQDDGLSVAIVTIDTYRMAAVEQLRAMAEMLDVPFEVAFNTVDLRRAVQRFGDRDRVLIDTTGRSPFDLAAIEALRATLQGCRPHVALCLPAATRRGDVDAIHDAYRRCGTDSIILTKWDETRAPGEALSFAIEQGIPIARITLGQEVPDDIVNADAAAIAASALAHDETEMEQLL